MSCCQSAGLFALTTALLLTSLPAPGWAQNKSGWEVRTIASNATYGCRRPFGAGVYDPDTNSTTVCWNGEGMSVYARRFDHKTATWGPARRVWKNAWFTKWDYHNYPTVVLAPDGHLLIFFFQHSSKAYMLRSPSPGAIEGTWTRTLLPASRPAYPMPIVCGEEVYLFYSRSDNISQAYRTYRYIKSADNGKTWSQPRMAIDSQQKVPGRFDEVYAIDCHVVPAAAGRPARIQLTWEMHGGPGHNIGSRNNHFVYFLPRTGKFQAVDGTDLGEWVDFTEMENKCVVHRGGARTGHPMGYSITTASLSDAAPLVLYRDGAKRFLAVWDGQAWTQRPTPPSTGDIARTSEGRLRIFGSASRQLAIHESADGGKSWRKVWAGAFPHADGSDSTCNRGLITNAHPDIPAMLCGKNSQTSKSDYSGRWPVVIIGNTGPVDR
ncbi:MAG: BNR-4 repeat-containing protein [Phycisphaerae bacterium]